MGDEVTSSFSISQVGLTSLMERQSLGMEAGGDGAEPGGKPRQTQTHAHARTHAQTGMRAHTHTHTHMVSAAVAGLLLPRSPFLPLGLRGAWWQ